jgi:uncharacterized protein (TIGR00255 family)
MTKSMTAYGRTSHATAFGRLVIEVQSVNRKMLDINVYLPKDLLRFEVDMRKWLSSDIERGQVTVRVTLQAEQTGGGLWQAQAAQLKALKGSWDTLARDLGCDPQNVDLRFLVEQLQKTSPFQTVEEEAPMRDALEAALSETLLTLNKMKQQEGKVLGQDILKRLDLITEALKVIESRKELPLVRYQQKIRERLAEISALSPELEEKIARELALLAEKMDITEEIVRLYSHMDQLRAHLSSSSKSIGRTLDFLVQEMNREINTLGAKSADTEVSTLVVKMKGELEKIREQVQNIE